MEKEGELRLNFDTSGKTKMALSVVIATILVVLIVAVIVYIIFFRTIGCTTLECFQENMKDCNKAVYINEGTQAVWLYSIKGISGGECNVNVKLLSTKEGESTLEDLEGFSMDCAYPKGIFAYPEKDLKFCHGRLKEEFQTVTIDRLHTLIVNNLESIARELGSVGGF